MSKSKKTVLVLYHCIVDFVLMMMMYTQNNAYRLQQAAKGPLYHKVGKDQFVSVLAEGIQKVNIVPCRTPKQIVSENINRVIRKLNSYLLRADLQHCSLLPLYINQITLWLVIIPSEQHHFQLLGIFREGLTCTQSHRQSKFKFRILEHNWNDSQ